MSGVRMPPNRDGNHKLGVHMNQKPVYLCLVFLGLGLVGILVPLLDNPGGRVINALMIPCAIVIAGSIVGVAIASQRHGD